MNRRGFFSTLAKAAAGFTILPAATTYERIWRVQRPEFLIVDAFTDFEGVDFYNRLPLWQVRILNGLSRKPLDTVWLKLLNKAPFPPNMGEVISQPNKLTTNNYAQLQNPIHKVPSAR